MEKADSINEGRSTLSEIVVRYQETDQMGVAHHSCYPIWFEVGRTDFISKHGIPYGKLEKEGLFLPLIGLSCKYRGFSRYEDRLYVRTFVKNLSRTRISFSYEISLDNHLIAEGDTEHVFADPGLKPVNLSKYNPSLLRLFSCLLPEDSDTKKTL